MELTFILLLVVYNNVNVFCLTPFVLINTSFIKEGKYSASIQT